MDDLDGVQPVCLSCATVMRDHPKGFYCVTCMSSIDTSEVMEAVVIPPDFQGPTIYGG